jgi:hypothetical protein
MRPKSADTSEPACVKRKMLSTKNSTSLPSSSRKYSAIVSTGEADAQARTRRLVHLAEHHDRLCDDARLGHLAIEVVALTRALAHTGEHRETAVLRGDVADQLLDQHRLADRRRRRTGRPCRRAGRAQESTTLMPVSNNCFSVSCSANGGTSGGSGSASSKRAPGLAVDRVAGEVEDAAETGLAHGHHDGRAGVHGLHAAHEAVGVVHGDAAHDVVAHVQGRLDRQPDARAASSMMMAL